MKGMQRIFTLFFLFISLSLSFAQTRYLDEVFSISKHGDILYGSNYDSKNQLTNLLMDVYEPQDDTASLRPIIFFVHGGSFIGGDRGDQGINKTAEFFAKKGYVTANIEYRVQQTTIINPIIDFADVYAWHRAIARATQDLKAAIRYIKKDVALNNNSYKVDTNSIFIYGSSAGAITALHAVFLDDSAEMNAFFKSAYRDLGGIDGNSGNPGYSMKGIKAVVSCSGALADLNYVNNNKDIQYLAFHNNPDLTVPFDAGCFVTVACWLGQYYGANKIFPKIRNNGTYAEFYPINQLGHPADQVADTASHRMILQKTTNFLYRIVNENIVTSVRNTIPSFELFPNPSTGNFTIHIPKEIQAKDAVIEITDIQGQRVFSSETRNKEIVSPDTALPNGMYVVSISTDTKTYTAKLCVVK
jgi:para-nitrobenzyl esterase